MIETPPNVLGVIDDHWFQDVTDFGRVSPDKGKCRTVFNLNSEFEESSSCSSSRIPIVSQSDYDEDEDESKFSEFGFKS